MRITMLRSLRWILTCGVALCFTYNLWLRTEVLDIDIYGPSQRIHTKSAFIYEYKDYTDLVNVFIGTTNLGHVFPGATLPHGMVKVGMDTDSPDGHAGYDANPRYHATGFSQLHDDGTGGGIPLSNFKLWPLNECSDFSNCPVVVYYRQTLRAEKEDGTPDDEGHPGYFSTNLSTGIRVELTATRRTALHRYTFPSVPAVSWKDIRPRILVDVQNDGQRSASNAKLSVDPITGRIMGGANFLASFGTGHYDAFVCVDFRSENYDAEIPAEYGVYQATRVYPNETSLRSTYGQQGGIVTFSPNESGESIILARVGISLQSANQACLNAEEEMPDFNFEAVRGDAKQQWNELLGRFQVQIDEQDRDTAVLFYSSLYRTHIVPSDFSEENPLWVSDEPYYDGLYCNWDTYRTLFPLMSLHDPITFSKVIRSFIDVQQHEGWLPECRDATLQQWVQGGSNGDPIVAEFFVKFKGYAESLGISADDLYTSLLQDAEVESPNWDLAGREADIWKELGYIPIGGRSRGGMNTRQVSRTLEYAYDDFTIAQVAQLLNKTDDWLKYTNRSRGFENVWNPNTTIDGGDGIRGFMQPRHANGSFAYTDPRHCTVHDPTHSTCYLSGSNHDGFYEGGPIVYSQYVPHDTARLIELQGGNDAFINRLDFIFDNDYFDCTNEPSQQIPFMYHYANRPGLSTERARQTIIRYFNTTSAGLPGNDDSGAMGSYIVFYLLGLYPLPATRQFLVSSPHFSHVRIWNPLFKTFTTINAHGFEGNPPDGAGGNIYVKSIKINGIPWKSICYIEWDVFQKGAIIDLELTNNRTLPCGANPDALPPSLSSGGYDP